MIFSRHYSRIHHSRPFFPFIIVLSHLLCNVPEKILTKQKYFQNHSSPNSFPFPFCYSWPPRISPGLPHLTSDLRECPHSSQKAGPNESAMWGAGGQMKYVHNLVSEDTQPTATQHCQQPGNNMRRRLPQQGGLCLRSHMPAPLTSARALDADKQTEFGLSALMTMWLFPIGVQFCAWCLLCNSSQLPCNLRKSPRFYEPLKRWTRLSPPTRVFSSKLDGRGDAASSTPTQHPHGGDQRPGKGESTNGFTEHCVVVCLFISTMASFHRG